MRYIPLRVHTVFSRGRGAVDPYEFALFARRNGIKTLSVSDRLSVIPWESFFRTSADHGLRFLAGTEIPFRATGSALLHSYVS